jgi:hypothetical protein
MDIDIIEELGLPPKDELCAASALLLARPDLVTRFSEEDIAVTEYGYYATQTYLFEMVGFQLLGEMVAKLRRFDFVHELASQSRDEARHAQIYRDVVRELPNRPSPAAVDEHASRIYDAFVAVGTIEEKVVTSYFVLESIAVGIFAARQLHYRSSPLALLDRRILVDEARHQGMGIQIAAALVRGGRLGAGDVTEIVRSASDTVARLLEPTVLFDRFGVGSSAAEREAVLSAGFLATQRATSRKAMLTSLRRLRRDLDGQGEGYRAFAA